MSEKVIAEKGIYAAQAGQLTETASLEEDSQFKIQRKHWECVCAEIASVVKKVKHLQFYFLQSYILIFDKRNCT